MTSFDFSPPAAEVDAPDVLGTDDCDEVAEHRQKDKSNINRFISIVSFYLHQWHSSP